MKLHRKIILFVLIIIAISLTGCQPEIPGINQPVIHDDREVILTSAEFLEVYTDATKRDLYPASSNDHFLVVQVDITPTDEIEHDNWKATIVDELGNSQVPTITTTRRVMEGDSLSAEWIFVVSRDAESFSLKLGENEIALVDSVWVQPAE